MSSGPYLPMHSEEDVIEIFGGQLGIRLTVREDIREDAVTPAGRGRDRPHGGLNADGHYRINNLALVALEIEDNRTGPTNVAKWWQWVHADPRRHLV